VSGFISKNNELLLGGYDKKVARFVKKGKICDIKVTSYLRAISIKTKKAIR